MNYRRGRISCATLALVSSAVCEAALTSNVTGRLEYRHTDLGTANAIHQTNDDLMLGVAMKF